MLKKSASLLVVIAATFALGGCSRSGPMPASPRVTSAMSRIVTVAAPTPAPVTPVAAAPVLAPTRAATSSELVAIKSTLDPWMQTCFESWMESDPEAAGRAVFDVVYSTSGTIDYLRMVETSLPVPTTNCLHTGVAKTTIAATDGLRVVVRIPLELSPPPAAPAEPVVVSKR